MATSTQTPVLGSKGDRVDLLIRQGATFGPHELTLTNPPVPPAIVGTPVNLSGCTLRGQIRRNALAAEAVADLVCTVTDAAAGKATLGLTAATTTAIPVALDPKDPLSSGVWDLELVDAAGRVTPVFYGGVVFVAEVTRA